MQKNKLNPESLHVLELYIKKRKPSKEKIDFMIEFLLDGMARPYKSRLEMKK